MHVVVIQERTGKKAILQTWTIAGKVVLETIAALSGFHFKRQLLPHDKGRGKCGLRSNSQKLTLSLSAYASQRSCDLMPNAHLFSVSPTYGVLCALQLNPDHCIHQDYFYCSYLVFIPVKYFLHIIQILIDFKFSSSLYSSCFGGCFSPNHLLSLLSSALIPCHQLGSPDDGEMTCLQM